MTQWVLEKVSPQFCTGCGACVARCPFGVLEMVEDEDGFFMPGPTAEGCRDCGLCLDVCPVLHDDRGEAVSPPGVYAAWADDEKLRLLSASGGAFAVLAGAFLHEGGRVAGASYGGLGKAVHVLIDTVADLKVLQGSKYVQSRAEAVYGSCLVQLERGERVLFSGTPCQVRAMGLLAEERGVAEGLLTADLVCYGVPSSLFVRRYLQWLENRYGDVLQDFRFRETTFPWEEYGPSATFGNGSVYRGNYRDDPFYRGFEISVRESCYDCPFNRFPRYGDLTLGDFWGIDEEIKDEKGMSLVLVNSSKGADLLAGTEGLHLVVQDLASACRENLRVDGRSLSLSADRRAFFDSLRSRPLEEAIDRFL